MNDTRPDLDIPRLARLNAQWGRVDHAAALLLECVQAAYTDPADYPPREFESVRVSVERLRDELMEKVREETT